MKPWTLHHAVGFGDFLNAESFWSPERKAALATIWHAWPGSTGAMQLIDACKACPDFRHIKHKGLSYPTEIPPDSIPTIRDQNVFHRMTFHGSSFLKHPLKCEVPGGLPGRFVYIQPDTPKNGPNCGRWLRDEEWPSVIGRLEASGLTGLVVNTTGGKATVPTHPLIVDWTGRTNIAQSIEVLKRARGYIGIDSCFAILAAQLFKPDQLAIRTNNHYVVERADAHYPPHAEFPFLYPRLDGPPHPYARPKLGGGIVVEARVNTLFGTRTFGPCTRVEVDRLRANDMLKRGHAVKVDDLES